MVAEGTAAALLISGQQPQPREDRQGRWEGGREGIGQGEIGRAILPSLILYLISLHFSSCGTIGVQRDQGGRG